MGWRGWRVRRGGRGGEGVGAWAGFWCGCLFELFAWWVGGKPGWTLASSLGVPFSQLCRPLDADQSGLMHNLTGSHLRQSPQHPPKKGLRATTLRPRSAELQRPARGDGGRLILRPARTPRQPNPRRTPTYTHSDPTCLTLVHSLYCQLQHSRLARLPFSSCLASLCSRSSLESSHKAPLVRSQACPNLPAHPRRTNSPRPS